MENTLTPAELIHSYLEAKTLVSSLSAQLEQAKAERDDLEFNIRTQLIQPNEYAPLLIDGNILVQMWEGNVHISRVTKL
ncbi:hypothetical protein [Pseudanabaena minima]|uniref:hypothetical protein n=1 Tax=Pseudanabaena minima TaxID=890415 RepID=UPI003DA9DC5C